MGKRFWSKFWKWPKLLNFVPFIKKTHVNHLYNRIWSFWIAFTFFTVKEDNLQNDSIFMISAKSHVCVFGQNLKIMKLLNFVPFIKKTHVKHVCNLIWSFWITFPFLQSRKTNFKMSQFSRFLPRCGYAILIKILKMTKTFYFVPFIKKTHLNHVKKIQIDHFESLSHFYSQTSKWVNFQDFC